MHDPTHMPACPRCGAAMRLARTVPRAFGMPELRSFLCGGCGNAVTVEVPERGRAPSVEAGRRATK